MKVVEIFNSIEGEGIRAGSLCTFIRLFGCNLNCSYCDSRYACEGTDYMVLSIPEIMDAVAGYGCKRVTVTGGEPLIHPGIKSLLEALVYADYEVNVETNGSKFPIPIVLDEPQFDYRRNEEIRVPICKGSIFYTLDWKCPTSGMESKMSIDIVNRLTEFDVLKFVVSTVADMDAALSVIEQMTSKPTIFFSPVFKGIDAADIVKYMQEKRLQNCRVQLQMHKYIWDPNERGV